MENNAKQLMQRLNYEFTNIELLETALSHRSVVGKNNERLEFLGDAVLSCIIADELYRRHPNAKEGELSRMRSFLVNGEMLAVLARDFELSEYLRLGPGELKTGGKERTSILADAVEAIIGAIFLDGGFAKCHQCVLQMYGERFQDLSTLAPTKDAKSELQEWLQAHKYPLPEYEVQITGAAHAQTFHATCRVLGIDFETKGTSTSRRKAEQQAAQRYLEIIYEQF